MSKEQTENEKNLEYEEIEELTFHAFKQVRKGFISSMILAVLQEQEMHGYGIIKEIEKKTQGIWTPNTSSIYPVLSDLKGKGLVSLSEKKEKNGRERKIYEITKKGVRFLRYFVQKFQVLISRLRTLTLGAFGFDANYPLDQHMKIMREHPIFGWQNGKSKNEKMENLNYYNNLIDERIIALKNLKKYVKEEISSLTYEGGGK